MDQDQPPPEPSNLLQVAGANNDTAASDVTNNVTFRTAELEAYEAWENDFKGLGDIYKTIMNDSSNDENFLKFRSEFEKVYGGVVDIKGHAKQIVDSYGGLCSEILQTPDLVTKEGSKDDQDAIALKTLKQQTKTAEDMLESGGKREELLKAELRQLKHDITNLSATIKQGVGLSVAQERAINELIAGKEQATKDLENELDKIVQLRNGLVTISEKIEKTEVSKNDLEEEIHSLKEKNTEKRIEIDNEMRNKDRLEQELREQRVVVTIKSQEVAGKQNEVNRATEDIAVIESQIKLQKQMIEKLLRDQESLGSRTVKLQHDYDEQMSETSKLVSENQSSMVVLKIKEAELLNHIAEVKKVARIKEILIKKNRILEDQKFQAEFVRKGIRADNDSRMAEVERRKRQIESTRKNQDDLTRERDILKSSLGKTQIESTKLSSLVLLQKQQMCNIELEMVSVKQEVSEHLKDYRVFEHEKKEGETEILIIKNQCASILAELKEKEVAIFDFKRQMFSAENKLKHQQNIYEGIQSDRNLHAKQLIESQAAIADMKRNLRIMNFQINGYKDDINSKDASVVKEAAENLKLTKDTLLIEDEIKTLKNQNTLAQAYIRSQMAEEVKLDHFVKEAEIERSRQENALSVLVNERDSLSTQLIHRNDELTQVYDKIKTQQSSLIRGEAYYREKLKAIRQLRENLHDKKLQRMKLAEETSGVPDMKKTFTDIHNQVTQEKMRIKALEEELKNPINVHRWRKLEGSNPQAFEMLQMLHSLQKKLISKTKEEKEKQEAIEIKEKLYLHLKAMLAKQVGPEATEQCNDFVKALKEKKLQLRHMDTELNMYQAQVREYKHSIGELNYGLADIKKKFLGMYMKRAAQSTMLHLQKDVKIEMDDELPPLPVAAESPENGVLEEAEEDEEYESQGLDDEEYDAILGQ